MGKVAPAFPAFPTAWHSLGTIPNPVRPKGKPATRFVLVPTYQTELVGTLGKCTQKNLNIIYDH